MPSVSANQAIKPSRPQPKPSTTVVELNKEQEVETSIPNTTEEYNPSTSDTKENKMKNNPSSLDDMNLENSNNNNKNNNNHNTDNNVNGENESTTSNIKDNTIEQQKPHHDDHFFGLDLSDLDPIDPSEFQIDFDFLKDDNSEKSSDTSTTTTSTTTTTITNAKKRELQDKEDPPGKIRRLNEHILSKDLETHVYDAENECDEEDEYVPSTSTSTSSTTTNTMNFESDDKTTQQTTSNNATNSLVTKDGVELIPGGRKKKTLPIKPNMKPILPKPKVPQETQQQQHNQLNNQKKPTTTSTTTTGNLRNSGNTATSVNTTKTSVAAKPNLKNTATNVNKPKTSMTTTTTVRTSATSATAKSNTTKAPVANQKPTEKKKVVLDTIVPIKDLVNQSRNIQKPTSGGRELDTPIVDYVPNGKISRAMRQKYLDVSFKQFLKLFPGKREQASVGAVFFEEEIYKMSSLSLAVYQNEFAKKFAILKKRADQSEDE
eukprot:TRINITY_DN5117_c1_g2_i1.p1 TRINITY_DN5117_c1_g2~~TRINITY_DN5117_c1_g2_i1.p1  ORF type:complete len:489 (-),score=157.77 TRINITY_DN5117_c1_g2_i1:1291-2757(-)